MSESVERKYRIDPLSKTKSIQLETFNQNDSKAELYQKLERTIGFIENAPLGIFKTNPQGMFIYANNKIALIFGYDSAPAFLKEIPNIQNLYASADDRKKILQTIKENGFIENAEIEFKKPDGQLMWVSVSGRGVVCQGGDTIYEGFIVDVTPKKLALNALHESETRFRQLVTQASEAFFLHDYKGKIIDVNRQACVSLGFSRDELLQMNLADIDIEIQTKKHKIKYWERLNPHDYITFEGRHKHKDGTLFPVEVRLGRIDLKEGPLLLSFVRDISDRIKQKEELKQAFCEIKKLKDQLEEENIYLRKKVESSYRDDQIIGESDSIQKMLNMAQKVAHQNTCVLISGETGTGKELLAHAIHNMSNRNNRAMVTVNCASLPGSLIESELFGRDKGAFTGAISRRTGRFEAADKSTLFLDEIAELPLELQAKLLRVLQDGRFERLGSSETISVDVRVLAATNQDLAEMIRGGKFRKDLYYRLNVFPITVPPLRYRQSDIPLLVWAFINEFSKRMGKKITHISHATMEKLVSHPWPGNVRELKNIIERAMIMSSGDVLEIHGLENIVDTADLNLTLMDVERNHILSVLKETGWRVSGKGGAAIILGLKPTTLEARMKKLGIKRPER